MAIIAPAGWSEDDEAEVSNASFAVSAPSGFSDSEDDDAQDTATSCRSAPVVHRKARGRRQSGTQSAGRMSARSTSAVSSRHSPLPSSQHRASTPDAPPGDWGDALQQMASFLAGLQVIEDEELRGVAAIQASTQQAREAWAEEEAQRQGRALDGRSQLLSRLQRSHHASAAAMNQRVAAAVAAAQQAEEERKAEARRKAEAEAQERAEKEAQQRAEEAESKRRQEEARRKREEAERAQAAEKQAAQRRAQKPPEAASTSQSPHTEKISVSAAALSEKCQAALEKVQAAASALQNDDSRKAERRKVDKAVTLHVNQISATEEQVRGKGEALAQLLTQGDAARRSYALLKLVDRILGQCECQVALTHTFCFPLGEVTQAVAGQHPNLAPCLLARLHAACPLSVPHSYARASSAPPNDESYLQLSGYRKVDPPPPKSPPPIRPGNASGGDTSPPAKVWESTDAVASRTRGFVLFLAAVLQSGRSAPGLGLDTAWQWVASFLNTQPSNRLTAVALDAFLGVAGYCMHQQYRGQFLKLLQCVDSAFLPALATSGDADARSVHARLHTFIHSRMWASPPEGRAMPKFDVSGYERA